MIPLIKETYNANSDKDFVKLKLCRDPTYSMSDLFDFKMSLFDHGETEDHMDAVDGSKYSVSLYASPWVIFGSV